MSARLHAHAPAFSPMAAPAAAGGWLEAVLSYVSQAKPSPDRDQALDALRHLKGRRDELISALLSTASTFTAAELKAMTPKQFDGLAVLAGVAEAPPLAGEVDCTPAPPSAFPVHAAAPAWSTVSPGKSNGKGTARRKPGWGGGRQWS